MIHRYLVMAKADQHDIEKSFDEVIAHLHSIAVFMPNPEQHLFHIETLNLVHQRQRDLMYQAEDKAAAIKKKIAKLLER